MERDRAERTRSVSLKAKSVSRRVRLFTLDDGTHAVDRHEHLVLETPPLQREQFV